MPGHLITLLTDFGNADAYVGVMKGVILGIDPSATVVDLTHDVPPQDILQGAFLLGTAWQAFPAGTIHVAVVDPGVGTDRRALLVQGGGHTFLAPDNGLLSFVLPRDEGKGDPFQPYTGQVPKGYTAHSLTNQRYWRHPVSTTFHGRDIFAPVAAHLSTGVPADELGEGVTTLVRLAVTEPRWNREELAGLVMHIDRFGNVVTSIPEALTNGGQVLTIELGGQSIQGLVATYGAGVGLVALIGSNGYLEIAVRDGRAAQLLGVKVGDEVRVRRG